MTSREMAAALVSAALLGAPMQAGASVEREDFEGRTLAALVQLCTADESTETGKYAIGFCCGWLQGVEQFYDAMLRDDRFEVKPVACPDRAMSRAETRDLVVRYGHGNPDALSLPPLEGVLRALQAAYPCT
jgi:hypothetical protein